MTEAQIPARRVLAVLRPHAALATAVCGRVLGIVAVGIEPQTPSESGVGDQRLLWRSLDHLDHTPMHLLLLLEYPGQGQVGLLRRHQGVESVDATIHDRIAWRPPAFKHGRQMSQRFLLPGGHVRDDVFDRPRLASLLAPAGRPLTSRRTSLETRSMPCRAVRGGAVFSPRQIAFRNARLISSPRERMGRRFERNSSDSHSNRPAVIWRRERSRRPYDGDRTAAADAVSQVHTIDAPCPLDGTVTDREDHTVTTTERHDLGP